MHFSTRTVKQAFRNDAMNEALTDLCGSLKTNFTQNVLNGSIESHKVGTFDCARIEQSATEMHRGWKEIDQGVPEHYIITLQLSGECECIQSSRKLKLSPGKLTIIDATKPYHLSFFGKNIQFILHIPKQDMNEISNHWHRYLATLCQPSATILIRALIMSSFEQGDLADDVHAQTISNTIIKLINESYQSKNQQEEVGRNNNNNNNQLKLVQEYLLNYLTDQNLSPKIVAKAQGLSERHLHRLFQSGGLSMSRWIRQSRLDRCAVALSDKKLKHLQIAEIAHHWGFSDAAHFSRIFRLEFGETPSEYRLISQKN